MRYAKMFLLIVSVVALDLGKSARADHVANLAGDYLEPGSPGVTSEDVTIAGAAATWHYYYSTDSNPAGSEPIPLTFYEHIGPTAGTGYGGPGHNDTAAKAYHFPFLMDDSGWSSVPAVPSGSLHGMGFHDSDFGGQDIEYHLLIELRASAHVIDLLLTYQLEELDTRWDGIDWLIADDDYSTLAFGNDLNGGSVSGTIAVPDMYAGDSLWLVISPNNEHYGDSTFISMDLTGTVGAPEPSTGMLLLLVPLAACASRRRRRA